MDSENKFWVIVWPAVIISLTLFMLSLKSCVIDNIKQKTLRMKYAVDNNCIYIVQNELMICGGKSE